VLTAATIAVGAAATLAIGLMPGPVLELAGSAGQFLR
jgi:NADH-quinone oxidoreductase subunit N